MCLLGLAVGRGCAVNVIEKLEILADAAKYDVACTSSGVQRAGKAGQLGAATQAGCCHSFTPDGRCVTLLKVLMTNVCVYDCCYCVNRASNAGPPRAAFTPRELADLTIGFYRRNYIEGLFLSSGVAGCPDRTTELMIEALRILREEYGFRGYIHTKAIPGTSVELIDELGRLSDRLSVNLELPSRQSLGLLAPNKSRASILAPMRHICDSIADDAESRSLAKKRTTVYLTKKNARKARAFAPAGQSTQMIVGATPESDYQILNLSAALYTHLSLKRVFFSAYLPVVADPLLPATDAVQLNREHRLYQADWLLRFYGFNVSEIIDEENPFLAPDVDPKANWALNHLDFFPVEVNSAPLEALLRVPEADALELSCLKGVFSGGDSLSVELKKRFDAFLGSHGATIKVREGYGTTECVTASCLTPMHKAKEGSIGLPFPDTYYKIVKPGTTQEVPYGEEGEICLAGPTVMLCYVNHPKETADTMKDHGDGLIWVHTGDLGKMDEEGFIYFRQRIKRMIVTNGYNVYPSQIENVLEAHEAVHLACVIGVKDPIRVQRVKAFIMLKPGYEGSEELKKSILEHCTKYVAKYAMPRELEFRPELPKTLVGKVAYRVLEEEEAAKER